MSKTLETVTLKNLRASFVQHIFEKGEFNGVPNKKYSVVLIFDAPEHDKIVKGLDKQVASLAKDELGGDLPENRYNAWKDDDIRGKKNRAEYKGYRTLKASNADRFLIVGKDKKPVTQEDGVFYSGCRVNVQVSLWANDGKNGPILGANLVAIQFAGDDEPFGEGAVDMEQAMEGFDEIESDDPFA